jgi:hypothetical protein
MDLSTKVEDALHEALKTGPPNTRSSALKAALDQNQDLIRKAIAQGYSPTGLAKKLKDAGISASVETLRQYVKHVTKTKATATAKKPKAPASQTKAANADSDNKAYEAEDRTA